MTSATLTRTVGLTRANALLMTRNKLTLLYGLVLPLLPLTLLFAGERGDAGPGAAAVVSTLMLAMLFPIYYNVLSQFVTRRDELVLKRLRTGEVRDIELLTSIALPGLVVAVAVSLVTIPIAMALGQSAPLNPVVYVGTVLVASVLFVAFAFWTAAWTKNAEAAQITSMPVIILAVIGQVSIGFPESLQRFAELTPGYALTDLVRTSWFGLEEGSTESTMAFGDTWAAAGQPLLVLAAWGAVAVWLASRSMQWEPRV